MEKVTKLKASKNLDVPKPKDNLLANPSFTSFDNCVLLEMAASLGISLGSDCKQVASSVQYLKNEEASRLHELSLNNTVQCKDDGDASTECSVDDVLNLEVLNNFCSELTECFSDEGCDLSDLHSTISQIQFK